MTVLSDHVITVFLPPTHVISRCSHVEREEAVIGRAEDLVGRSVTRAARPGKSGGRRSKQTKTRDVNLI